MSTKVQKFFFFFAITCALIVFCAPSDADARVIFHGKQRILTGQILSARRQEKPCEKCHMRDHRGNCRRIISFNSNGVQC